MKNELLFGDKRIFNV